MYKEEAFGVLLPFNYGKEALFVVLNAHHCKIVIFALSREVIIDENLYKNCRADAKVRDLYKKPDQLITETLTCLIMYPGE